MTIRTTTRGGSG